MQLNIEKIIRRKAMKRIKIDRNKCIGCLTCTTACIVAHEVRGYKKSELQ